MVKTRQKSVSCPMDATLHGVVRKAARDRGVSVARLVESLLYAYVVDGQDPSEQMALRYTEVEAYRLAQAV